MGNVLSLQDQSFEEFVRLEEISLLKRKRRNLLLEDLFDLNIRDDEESRDDDIYEDEVIDKILRTSYARPDYWESCWGRMLTRGDFLIPILGIVKDFSVDFEFRTSYFQHSLI